MNLRSVGRRVREDTRGYILTSLRWTFPSRSAGEAGRYAVTKAGAEEIIGEADTCPDDARVGAAAEAGAGARVETGTEGVLDKAETRPDVPVEAGAGAGDVLGEAASVASAPPLKGDVNKFPKPRIRDIMEDDGRGDSALDRLLVPCESDGERGRFKGVLSEDGIGSTLAISTSSTEGARTDGALGTCVAAGRGCTCPDDARGGAAAEAGAGARVETGTEGVLDKADTRPGVPVEAGAGAGDVLGEAASVASSPPLKGDVNKFPKPRIRDIMEDDGRGDSTLDRLLLLCESDGERGRFKGVLSEDGIGSTLAISTSSTEGARTDGALGTCVAAGRGWSEDFVLRTLLIQLRCFAGASRECCSEESGACGDATSWESRGWEGSGCE
ncbi:hypothetical protein B0H19DRAFT_1270779 [Mycena capillaripes]|nr:hypothetical protein B0H19DRAFT_1270779 [Mycena capillaripes]